MFCSGKFLRYILIICIWMPFLGYGDLQTETQIEEILAPQILVIFGATGDLTKRKLVPALVRLARNERLPKEFIFIGVGRREMSPAQFLEEISAFVPKDDMKFWEELRGKIVYLRGDFEKPETYERLSNLIKEINSDWKDKGDRLFYLATPVSNFTTIVKQLYQSNLLKNQEELSRVLIEKPFGHDLASAVLLQKELSQYLDASQMYLVDHYLGKEMVRNLLAYRFVNPIFESFWNHDHIDHVSITISEDIGVESRGAFFEETGLLRDIIQNHAMQLLSLIAMEKPESFSSEDIRKEKVCVLQSIRPFPICELDHFIIRGQYAEGIINGSNVPGYRQENGVAQNSAVETFVAAKLFLDTPRWKQVPFYIKAGKRLSKKYAEIAITLKTPQRESDQKGSPNQLIFRIQPQEEVVFELNLSGTGATEMAPTKKLSLNLQDNQMHSFSNAYERILFDAMAGDPSNFASYEEHLIAWQLFSPVLDYWKQNPSLDFPDYVGGSEGPDISNLYN
jgi:glucose-6-phosphate 1-dehydrogenase